MVDVMNSDNCTMNINPGNDIITKLSMLTCAYACCQDTDRRFGNGETVLGGWTISCYVS